MINTLLYYTLNMSIAVSSPLIKIRRLDLLYTLNRGHLAIITDINYNMDSYLTEIYLSLARYSICLSTCIAMRLFIQLCVCSFKHEAPGAGGAPREPARQGGRALGDPPPLQLLLQLLLL